MVGMLFCAREGFPIVLSDDENFSSTTNFQETFPKQAIGEMEVYLPKQC